jgi:hypothetical protein
VTHIDRLGYTMEAILCDCGCPARWVLTTQSGEEAEYGLVIPLCEGCLRLEAEAQVRHASGNELSRNRAWLVYDFCWHGG